MVNQLRHVLVEWSIVGCLAVAWVLLALPTLAVVPVAGAGFAALAIAGLFRGDEKVRAVGRGALVGVIGVMACWLYVYLK